MQVYVLNKIPHLHAFIIPSVYYLFILWLPFSTSRMAQLFIAFILGLSVDYFSNTPGLHAAACVLIAYVRPVIISILASKDNQLEIGYSEPSPVALGWVPFLVYAFILTLFHHGYLFFLEMLSFGGFWHFMGKLVASSAVSMLMIILVELIFQRRQKFRTNTA